MSAESPIVFFRVGYMDKYDGPAEIRGGGEYIRENKRGGEMWNFKPDSAGRCFGYVMTTGHGGVSLERVIPESLCQEGDELAGVDIVFFSPHPDGGQVIVGWYRNATLLHRQYCKRDGSFEKNIPQYLLTYVCYAAEEDSVLLPPLERDFQVPRTKGGAGQSNVWYGGDDSPDAIKFRRKVRRYLDRNGASKPKASTHKGGKGKPDKELIQAVEKAAVKKTKQYFKKLGYSIESVEKDCLGWDLEARKGEELLRVEVKGHAGNIIEFELTPNEFLNMKEFKNSYCVSVVTGALSKPLHELFYPYKEGGKWFLENEDETRCIKLMERVAAKAAEISLEL